MSDIEPGAMTARERFSRMEETLIRIEAKLDRKLDFRDIEPLIKRVELLESGETPLGKALLGQFTVIQQQVADLQLHGSQNAQSAIQRIASSEGKIDLLESAVAENETRINTTRTRTETNYRTWTIILAVLTTVALLISTIGTIYSLAHS